jgi:hypothetical protein
MAEERDQPRESPGRPDEENSKSSPDKHWWEYPSSPVRPGPLGSISARFRSSKKSSELPPEASPKGATSFPRPRKSGSAALGFEPTARTSDRDEEDYLRYFIDRTRWHQERAWQRKRRYLWLQVISLAAAAAIPVGAAGGAPQVVAAVLAFVTVVTQGLQQLLRDHEKAVAHERTAAAVGRELRRYHQRVEPYDDDARALDLLKRNLEEALATYELAYAEAETQEQIPRGS